MQRGFDRMSNSELTTFTYSVVEGHSIQFDLYLPPQVGKSTIPAVVFFHGGGLVSGSRKDMFFPAVFKDLTVTHGYAFISAEYRLLQWPATSGHHIVEDIKALWTYLSQPLDLSSSTLTIDLNNSVVAGASAGAYVARLASIYLSPQPKAMLLGYGFGGNLLSNRGLWLPPDNIPPLGMSLSVMEDLGEPLLARDREERKVRSSLPMFPTTGGFADELQAWIGGAVYQLRGHFLDLIAGEEGFSDRLRKSPSSEWEEIVRATPHVTLFPELHSNKYPPTFLFHGDNDNITLPSDSMKTYEQLKARGVDSELIIVEGADHGLWDPKTPPGSTPMPIEKDVYRKGVEFLAKHIEGK
ncbi:Alpha/Beta hydrolase protein [Flagelloscypha sp. PMI_526]|nr:Alpha/Beta hydrolase protein [Flagelloscypha sp. PMI_526]